MALLKCTDCGNMISEHATVCPYCGCPMHIIIEKSKIEPDKTVIEKQIAVASEPDLVKYRSLCKIPKEILEQMSLVPVLKEEIPSYELAEDAKAKEEVARLEQERQEEIARQKVEESEKKTKKIKKIAIACGAVVAALAILVKGVILPSMKENNVKEDNYEQEEIEMSNAEVGDSVYFGTYEQDNNVANGKEEIEWIVLAKEEDRILLLSKYALDCKLYDQTKDITWQECNLRRWLNDNFMDVAFTDEEEKMIPTVTVPADKNPDYNTNPGIETSDKIFLLSIKEVHQYVSSDEQRECKPTKYAIAQGVSANNKTGCVQWWLRSPGIYQYYAAFVNYDGGVSTVGSNVFNASYAVRPALWIDLNS